MTSVEVFKPLVVSHNLFNLLICFFLLLFTSTVFRSADHGNGVCIVFTFDDRTSGFLDRKEKINAEEIDIPSFHLV